MLKLSLAVSVVIFFQLSGAHAQTPIQIGKFKDWRTYSYQSHGQKNCYALTVPLTEQPDNVDHGDNFFMIAQTADGILQPQIKAGYDLQTDEPVVVTVDEIKIRMMTDGSRAWVKDEADEAELVALLRSRKKMNVDAVSARGTATHYGYSLLGATAAVKSFADCR